MNEIRSSKYGRFLVEWVKYTIETMPDLSKEDYRTKLKRELRKYPLISRRKGTPKNEGCIRELAGLDNINIRNPEHLARLIKEQLHLLYQKQRSREILTSLLENL